MKPWELAVRRPVATVMAMLVVVLLGAVSLAGLRLDLLPNLNAPVAVLITEFRGASAEEVRALVTEPLEAAAATTPGLSELSSFSQDNVAVVVARFAWGTNMAEARQDLAERVERTLLPDGASKPQVMKFDPTQAPILEYAVTGDRPLPELTALVRDVVKPRLESLAGVAAAQLTGGLDREVAVELDPDRLAAFGLDQAAVAAVIGASNLTLPAGTVRRDDLAPPLRVTGKLGDVAALEALVVGFRAPAPPAAPPGGLTAGRPPPPVPVRLGDVATVTDGFADRISASRLNGRDAVGLSILREGDANTVLVARAVRRELEELRQDYPDLIFVAASDQADFIEVSLRGLSVGLLQGGAIAVAVLFVFLRSVRSTIIIGLAIPFSVVATFVLLYFRGLTLNIMTVGGLALGVGMLVDNAIVVLESIYRQLQLGRPPAEAAMIGTEDVASAITASTLTTVVVFLPVVYVGGLTGELFKELALTVTFALLASLAVAVTVIPMLASRVLRAPRRGRHAPRAPASWYVRVLRAALRRRLLVVAVAAATLLAAVNLVPAIGTEFLPVVDEGTFGIDLEMPSGTDLDRTVAAVARVEAVLRTIPEVAVVHSLVGRSEGAASFRRGMAGGGTAAAEIIVRLVPEAERDRSTADVLAEVRRRAAAVPGPVRLGYNLLSSLTLAGAGGSNVLDLYVAAPDPGALADATGRIVAAVAAVPGMVGVTSSLEAARPEVRLVVDREAALARGLTAAQVAAAVANATRGQVVTRLEAGGASVPVRVRLAREARETEAALLDLALPSPLGRPVRLGEVAAFEPGLGPVMVARQNQRLSAVVSGLVEGRDLGGATRDAFGAIAALDLPAGVDVSTSGMARLMAEGFRDLRWALVLAVVLVYMIMAAQFESFAYPLVVLVSVPLAVVGVVAGLYLFGMNFGVTAFIGAIMLAGIVVNNAIVLVDATNRRRAEGLETHEALIEAGRIRLRPVVMTALTTMLGLAPMALGLGAGTQLQAPLGVAVIGGLATSTLLTLVVVPVVYSGVDEVLGWLGAGARRRRRRIPGTARATRRGTAAVAPPPVTGPVPGGSRDGGDGHAP